MTAEKRTLILVRHSAPQISPEVPASQWALSDEGRRRCEALAERLAAHELVAIITSTERKAIETGQIVADLLGIPCRTAPGLHEHERHNAGWQGSRAQFQARVASLFDNPDRLVFGSETADEAHRRFAAAITAVLEQHPSGNLAVVSHGTVLTLFVARTAGLDALPFWQRLGLPAFVVLALPSFSLMQVVENVAKS